MSRRSGITTRLTRRIGRRRALRARRSTATAINADDAIRQLTTSCELSTDLTDVLLGAPELSSNTALARIRPGTIGELDSVPLVRRLETLTMSTVGAQRVPQGVVPAAVIHIGVNLGPTDLAVRQDTVKTVSEEIAGVEAEDDNRRELRTIRQRRGVLANDVIVDLGTNLRTAIGDESVKGQKLTHGDTRRGVGRNTRRSCLR